MISVLQILGIIQPESPTPAPQSSSSGSTKPLDEDPDGLKLLHVGEPALEEASSVVDRLRHAAQLWPETHQMAYEIYSRQGRDQF